MENNNRVSSVIDARISGRCDELPTIEQSKEKSTKIKTPASTSVSVKTK